MYIDKTNEVMMNYYKKQEILKAKQRLDQERMPIVQVLQLADKEFITIDELLEALYIDKEEVFEEILNTQSVSENTTDVSANTANVSVIHLWKLLKLIKNIMRNIITTENKFAKIRRLLMELSKNIWDWII